MQAIVDGGVAKCALCVDPVRLDRCERQVARRTRGHAVLRVVGPADRFNRDGFHDERLARHQEAVLLPVLALELGDDLRDVFDTRLERRVGALVLDVQRAPRVDPLGGNALRRDVGPSGCLERGERRRGRAECGFRQHHLLRLLSQRAHVGEPHAVRR
jgi:hypothetical protein